MAMRTGGSEEPTAQHERKSWGAAIAASLFVFSVATDQVMMPIATSAVVSDLETDTGMVQAAIATVSLIAGPLYIAGGKLGDIRGKKQVFLTGLVLYVVGLLTAVFAPGIEVLVGGWSVVKGLGMVLAIPASVGLLVANYPDEGQRGQAFAMYGVGGVLAALVGPILMGWAAEALTWRLPFALLAGLIALTWLLSARFMEETQKVKSARVDWLGTAIAFVAVGSIILGSMLGSRFGWWLARRPFEIGDATINPLGLSPTPWLIATGVLFAALLFARLNRIEEEGGQPLFSMRLFDNRTFFSAWTMGLLVFVATGAIPFVMPVFTQQALSYSALDSGLVMVVFSLGSIVTGFVSGTLMSRMQVRSLMQLSTGIVAAGLAWLVYVADPAMTIATFTGPMIVVGAGFGILSSQLPNVQVSTLDEDLQGEGSGFAETGKELGIGLGTAVIGGIMLTAALGGYVDSVARSAGLEFGDQERSAIVIQLEDESFPQEAAAAIGEEVPNTEQLATAAYVEGFQVAIGSLTGVILLALLVASFIPRVDEEEALAEKTKELVADTSSRRL